MSEQNKSAANQPHESSLEQFIQHCRIRYRSIHNNPRHINAVVALADQRDEAEQSRAINHAAAKLALDQRDALAVELAKARRYLSEAVRMLESYRRAGWLMTPGSLEHSSDFIDRVTRLPANETDSREGT